jgi:hypothetical protein
MGASAIMVLAGVVCLAISGFLMYHLVPRDGRPRSALIERQLGETAAALTQFVLMIFGLALVVKGLL